MVTDTERNDALTQIAEIAKLHHLTPKDIAAFMEAGDAEPHRKSEILTKLFSYLGGIFVLAGVCIYAGMKWDQMGPHAHIVITLGTGIVAYILAIVCLRDERYIRMATPLMLIAGLFEPGGMMVTIAEYSTGGDARDAFLIVFGIMAIQMALTFFKERRAVLLFLLMIYGSSWLGVMFDKLEFQEEWNAWLVGFFIMCVTWGISKTRYSSVCGFWYFLGSAMFLCASWEHLDDMDMLVAFIGLACFFVFLSVMARSRALLLNGVIAVLSFIGYYTAEYFADNDAWPLGLLFMGAVLIGMSKFAMNLNRKYIKQAEGA